MVRQIASFSTGLSSALMWKRLVGRYGKELVTVVSMDTLIEDDDNYRFARDMERYMGMEIVWLREGRDPYQVSERKKLIPNQMTAPCTEHLKIWPFVRYLKTLPEEFVINIGYDFEEAHRCARTTKNYEKQGWVVDYPLLWSPIEERDYSKVCREDWGIEPPRMYSMGYTHANCGGCCVKQGQGDWIRTLLNFPDRYAKIEAWEARMRENPVNADYSLVRKMRKMVSGRITLAELREEYNTGKLHTLVNLDLESSCVVCGAGDIGDENSIPE